MLARTVTRASASSWMPSLAIAATLGVVMTFGIHAHLHRLEHVPAGEIDRGRLLVGQRDAAPCRPR